MKRTVLRGRVVSGLGLGRRLGFPTANIALPPAQPLPPLGVYAVDAVWDGASHPAVCSVGVRPSLGPSGAVLVEVHVPGFSGDLYGKQLEVHFKRKLRDEMRFDSLGALVEQIRKDIVAAGQAPEA